MPWRPIRLMKRGESPDFTLLREPRNEYTTRAQQYFLDQILDLEPGTEDVDGGGYAHKRGYHDTREHNDARSGKGNDYSARYAPDRRGPGNKTRARDWTFRDAQEGDYRDFEKYGDRILAAYQAKDPRLHGWREYLGRVSEAIDVGGRSTRRIGMDFLLRTFRIPDSSHDWHGHLSELTEFVESFENKWAMLTVLAGWTVEEWQQSILEGENMATIEQKLDLLLRRQSDHHRQNEGDPEKGIRSDGTVYGFFQLRAELDQAKLERKAILAATTGGDYSEVVAEVQRQGEEIRAQAEQLAAELSERVEGVDEAVLARLGETRDPAETAHLLRVALGDQAEAVFRAGLEITSP